MLHFQVRPDQVFQAILHDALQHTREELDFAPGYSRPTKTTARWMSAIGQYPGITRVFARRELIAVLDRLLQANEQPTIYEITDYHWLVVHACLQVFCDLHNDAALGNAGHVGPYIIDTIDSDAIVSRFFWDTDFRLGSVLLEAEERAPGQVQATRQAWKIAAGLRPDPEDLQIVAVQRDEEEIWPPDPGERPVPESGYVGSYPLLESADAP